MLRSMAFCVSRMDSLLKLGLRRFRFLLCSLEFEAKKGRLLPLLKKDSHDGISFQELWDSGYICAGTTKRRGGKTIAIKLTREKIEALKGLELRALPDMIVAFDDKSLLKFKTTVNVEKIIDCRNERKSL